MKSERKSGFFFFFFLPRKIECPSILFNFLFLYLFSLFMISKTFNIFFFRYLKITLFYRRWLFIFILSMIIHFIDSDLLNCFFDFHLCFVDFESSIMLADLMRTKDCTRTDIRTAKTIRWTAILRNIILSARNVWVFGDLRSSSRESYLIFLLCSKSLFKRKKIGSMSTVQIQLRSLSHRYVCEKPQQQLAGLWPYAPQEGYRFDRPIKEWLNKK